MIEWSFTPEDVARIRFAFSPLAEAVLSLIVLRAPGSHSLHLPWVRATRPLVAHLDLSELFALVPTRGDTAGFLTPPPRSPLPDLARELQALRATPPGRVAIDLAAMPALPTAVSRRISADLHAAVTRLAATLLAYWDIALAGHWPRIAALLEADVLWRSKQLATGGAAALFEDLHQTIAWRSGRLTAADPHDYHGSLAGEGLLLVPTVMTWPGVRKMIAPCQPQLAYPLTAASPPCGRPGHHQPHAPWPRSSGTPALPCSPLWPNPHPPPAWPGGCTSPPAQSASTCQYSATPEWSPAPAPAAKCSTGAPAPATHWPQATDPAAKGLS